MPVTAAQEIVVNVSIPTSNGVLRFNDKTEFEAIDYVCDRRIANGEKVILNVQASSTNARKFFLAQAKPYSMTGKTLKYKVGNDWRELDGPLLLLGDAVKLIGGTADQIEFDNQTGEDVLVTIVAGRTASGGSTT